MYYTQNNTQLNKNTYGDERKRHERTPKKNKQQQQQGMVTSFIIETSRRVYKLCMFHSFCLVYSSGELCIRKRAREPIMPESLQRQCQQFVSGNSQHSRD